MNFLLKIIISAFAVFFVDYLISGVSIDNFVTALLVALVLAFLNAIVKPVLTILTIPVTILTLGLFLLVINAVIILLAEKIVNGFQVDGFWWAMLFSLILTVCTGIMNMLLGVNERDSD